MGFAFACGWCASFASSSVFFNKIYFPLHDIVGSLVFCSQAGALLVGGVIFERFWREGGVCSGEQRPSVVLEARFCRAVCIAVSVRANHSFE